MTTGRIIIGSIIILIGLSALTGWDVFRFIWPIFIIYIGYRVLTGQHGHWRNWNDWEKLTETSEDDLDQVVVFSARREKIESDNFEGGKLTAVFGGIEMDLSKVKAKSDKIYMEVNAVFGGITLRIPKDWKVKSDGVAVLGGMNNRSDSPKSAKVTLVLKGASVLGGIDIVN